MHLRWSVNTNTSAPERITSSGTSSEERARRRSAGRAPGSYSAAPRANPEAHADSISRPQRFGAPLVGLMTSTRLTVSRRRLGRREGGKCVLLQTMVMLVRFHCSVEVYCVFVPWRPRRPRHPRLGSFHASDSSSKPASTSEPSATSRAQIYHLHLQTPLWRCCRSR